MLLLPQCIWQQDKGATVWLDMVRSTTMPAFSVTNLHVAQNNIAVGGAQDVVFGAEINFDGNWC